MQHCHPKARSRLRRVGQAIERVDGVVGHTMRSPEIGDREEWTLDVTLQGGGIPSVVLTILGAYGVELGESQPQGDYWQFVATV